MTTHTPGPWKVNSFSGRNLACCGAGVTDIFTEEGDERVSIARVAYRDKGGDFGSRDEQTANARLIALAPEMVPLIDSMLAEHAADMHMGSDCFCPWCKAARALLARLDGKE